MKHVVIRYRVKREHVDKVKEAIVEFIDAVRRYEDGTLAYESFQHKNKVSFMHIMTFADQEAEDLHRNSVYVKKFVKILYPRCSRKPIFTDLNLVRSNRIGEIRESNKKSKR